MTAYYNEHDPKAAAWLRELIAQGHIAPGDVDERDIRDVRPDDLTPYTQCHFFAGIGVWSYALRLAGWPDDRPVWTGSPPCQPFSSAGRRGGVTDERHLWPHYHHLIAQCQPAVLFGEQVSSKDGLAWFDLVQADLENTGYAAGALDTCAAGVGAPHIRQRLYFFAERLGDTGGTGLAERISDRRIQQETVGAQPREAFKRRGDLSWMGHAGCQPCERGARGIHSAKGKSDSQRREDGRVGYGHSDASLPCGMANAEGERCREARDAERRSETRVTEVRDDAGLPGPTNGHWQSADWLFCRDGKWRPVEPGTFPLAHGAPARVGRLRGYGNAIVAQVAAEVVAAYLESESGGDLAGLDLI